MNNIVSFKDLFDLSAVFMQNAFVIMTSPFADASLLWNFLSGLGAVCRSNCPQVQRLLLFKQIVDGLYLSVFQCIAVVDFVQQFIQTNNAK